MATLQRGLQHNPYVQRYEGAPVNEFRDLVNSKVQQYDANRDMTDKLEIMAANINTLEPDAPVKEAALTAIREGVGNILKTGAFESASSQIRSMAKKFATDQQLSLAQQNYMKEMERQDTIKTLQKNGFDYYDFTPQYSGVLADPDWTPQVERAQDYNTDLKRIFGDMKAKIIPGASIRMIEQTITGPDGKPQKVKYPVFVNARREVISKEDITARAKSMLDDLASSPTGGSQRARWYQKQLQEQGISEEEMGESITSMLTDDLMNYGMQFEMDNRAESYQLLSNPFSNQSGGGSESNAYETHNLITKAPTSQGQPLSVAQEDASETVEQTFRNASPEDRPWVTQQLKDKFFAENPENEASYKKHLSDATKKFEKLIADQTGVKLNQYLDPKRLALDVADPAFFDKHSPTDLFLDQELAQEAQRKISLWNKMGTPEYQNLVKKEQASLLQMHNDNLDKVESLYESLHGDFIEGAGFISNTTKNLAKELESITGKKAGSASISEILPVLEQEIAADNPLKSYAQSLKGSDVVGTTNYSVFGEEKHRKAFSDELKAAFPDIANLGTAVSKTKGVFFNKDEGFNAVAEANGIAIHPTKKVPILRFSARGKANEAGEFGTDVRNIVVEDPNLFLNTQSPINKYSETISPGFSAGYISNQAVNSINKQMSKSHPSNASFSLDPQNLGLTSGNYALDFSNVGGGYPEVKIETDKMTTEDAPTKLVFKVFNPNTGREEDEPFIYGQLIGQVGALLNQGRIERGNQPYVTGEKNLVDKLITDIGSSLDYSNMNPDQKQLLQRELLDLSYAVRNSTNSDQVQQAYSTIVSRFQQQNLLDETVVTENLTNILHFFNNNAILRTLAPHVDSSNSNVSSAYYGKN